MTRLFRIVLRLYPAEFRRRYGTGVVETLRQRIDDARREGGRTRVAAVQIQELAGLVLGAARERLVRRSPTGPKGRRGPREGRTTMGRGRMDLRQAARRLWRSPAFTAAAAATVALAIGADTAVFSLLKGVVLDPLPYPDAGRLVWLDHAAPGIGAESGLGMTRGLFRFYRGNSRTLEEVAVYRTSESTFAAGGGEPERVGTLQGTWTLFAVLGARPLLGRLPTREDGASDGGGPAPVVLLSHGFWTRRFGASPDVLGRIVHLDGLPYEVVGVMPASFAYPDRETDAWIPTVPEAGFGGWVERGIGRAREGYEPADVQRDLAALVPRIPDAFEDDFARASVEDARITPRIVSLQEHVVGDVDRILWILMGGVGLVFLVVWANVAGLFLVRAEARQREMAVRRALGAGGGAVAAVLLWESGLVGLMGGAGGVLLARGGLALLVHMGPHDLPRLHEVALDGSALVFAFVLTAASALTFGLLPLLRRDPGVVEGLKEGGRSAPGRALGARSRNVLVTGQVAVALVLLVGSGLTVRSYRNLRRVDMGLRSAEVLTFHLGLPWTRYPTGAEAATLHQGLLDRLAALPGVESVGALRCLPLVPSCRVGGPLYQEDAVYQPGEVPPIVRINIATPGVFRTLGIRLVEGRTFLP
ncbi:MAG TPA: ABC transporter permease, partial [Longimicrobiales bacterium]|nr:ABC transporter permease [Longimicrobiales bacterium]